jgi:hypothetical protein
VRLPRDISGLDLAKALAEVAEHQKISREALIRRLDLT